jgi:hypothetical protein
MLVTEQDMVSFAIDMAVHPNAIVLLFIALLTFLQHLDIVGFLNIAREEVRILCTLLLCFFVCSRPVLDSIVVLKSPVQVRFSCLFWTDREPDRSLKTSEPKDQGLGPQKTGRNQS